MLLSTGMEGWKVVKGVVTRPRWATPPEEGFPSMLRDESSFRLWLLLSSVLVGGVEGVRIDWGPLEGSVGSSTEQGTTRLTRALLGVPTGDTPVCPPTPLKKKPLLCEGLLPLVWEPPPPPPLATSLGVRPLWKEAEFVRPATLPRRVEDPREPLPHRGRPFAVWPMGGMAAPLNCWADLLGVFPLVLRCWLGARCPSRDCAPTSIWVGWEL